MAGKSCFLIGSHLSPDALAPLLDEAIDAGRRSAIPESACGC